VPKLCKKNMITDLRKQKREIKIELEVPLKEADLLDEYIDNILKDLEAILIQRKLPKGLKIEIILE
jgi:hypothetical protein